MALGRTMLSFRARTARDGKVCGLTECGVLADAQFLGERVESHDVRLREGGDAVAAVAIQPAHVMMPLPGGFDEIAQEILVRFG